MSTTTNVALAAALLLGSLALAAGSHGKPVHRKNASKIERHAPATAPQTQTPTQCMVDEGGGRMRPCSGTGGGY